MDFFEGQYGHQKEDGQGDVKAHAAQDACGEALGEENGLSNGEDGSADEAMTAGFRPAMQPLTIRLFRKASKHRATKRMIRKDGRTTPRVAKIPPGIPASSVPT